MSEQLRQIKEHWDKTADSAWYRSLRTEEQIQALLEQPARAFHPAVYRLLSRFLPEPAGKRVLLPSSGDNHAAFALAALGARVVSADISQKQLDRAQAIARRHGLDIRFVCDDTASLSQFEDGGFDLVYTSNGTLTWIGDLDAMFRNFYRVLRPGGLCLCYDTHPFQRPFSGEPWKQPELIKPYSQVLPQLHWRVQDILNAMTGAGFALRRVEELPAADPSFWFTYEQLQSQRPEDLAAINSWPQNPMAALPAWIALVGSAQACAWRRARIGS